MAITLDGSNGITTDIASNESATFNRDTTDGDIIILQKDNSTVGSIGTGSGVLNVSGSNSNGIAFGNNKALPSTGNSGAYDNSYDLGVSYSRFKDLYLSGGVYLGGTGAANKLEDYEEGTFTPVVRDSSPTGSIVSFSVENATYTKIGNIVTVSIFLNRTDAGSYSGTFYVTALPFTSKSGIAHVAGGAWFDASSSDKRALAYIGGGQTQFIFPLAGAADSLVTLAQLPNGRPIYMGASYPVA